MGMRKIFYLTILLTTLLSIETVLALENIGLDIEMPKKVQVGENFTIDVYVKLSENITGLECKIDTPVYGTNYIKFTNVTENKEIKEKAGDFYIVDLKDNSVFISFALFDKPLNSDFHLITVEGRALKEGIVPIKFNAVVSDKDGKAIRISPIIYNLEIVSSDHGGNEKTENNKESSIFSWIIEVIRNFLKMIFSG